MISAPSHLVVGIAGGTGSGKTSVADAIARALPPGSVLVLRHDSYYRDRTDLSYTDRSALNYDHPNALDTGLLVAHLRALKAGADADVPSYDFVEHRRTGTRLTRSAPVIVVEGILLLEDIALREQLDVKVFVDTADDVRLLRRLRRDMEERGRTLESVVSQYMATVRPMHLLFVEPSKRMADVIIPEGVENTIAVDMVVSKILHWLTSTWDRQTPR